MFPKDLIPNKFSEYEIHLYATGYAVVLQEENSKNYSDKSIIK